MTLRGRLIAGLVALLAIGCATVGVTTYFRARDSLLREVGAQLQLATGLWYDCLSGNGGPGQGAGSWPPAGSEQPAPADPMKCNGLGAGTL